MLNGWYIAAWFYVTGSLFVWWVARNEHDLPKAAQVGLSLFWPIVVPMVVVGEELGWI